MARFKKLKPDKDALDDHTTFIETLLGKILRYATFFKNKLNPNGFDEVKRVDLFGDQHFNKVTNEFISTPHVHEKGIQGDIRNANEDEIPRRNKNK